MSNRAYLLAIDDPDITSPNDPKGEVLAEGMDEIPVFWASLFVPADRRIDTVEGLDGEEFQVANYAVDSNTSKARLVALREPVAKLLDARGRDLWSQWISFINGQNASYIRTEASEVWGLDQEGYDQYWETLLKLFSSPSPASLEAAAERNEIGMREGEIVWEEGVTVFKLAGAEHIGTLPWS